MQACGRNEDALYCTDRSLRLNHRNSVAWANRGNISGRMGKYLEALHCYERALHYGAKDEVVIRGRDQALEILRKRWSQVKANVDEQQQLDPLRKGLLDERLAWCAQCEGMIPLARYTALVETGMCLRDKCPHCGEVLLIDLSSGMVEVATD